ncbi:hypothetical protein E2C01_069730 [Portunus trituberculatus]|uniref:Uncharacterized protein n=1 Tax=Portunus trituberculatus TaxID=210409 RepID=A0A5B7I3L1_PORTR|nr:hypothetical protein [Portunus trituberculatus]
MARQGVFPHLASSACQPHPCNRAPHLTRPFLPSTRAAGLVWGGKDPNPSYAAKRIPPPFVVWVWLDS